MKLKSCSLLFFVYALSHFLIGQEFFLNRLGWEQGLVSAGVYDVAFDKNRIAWLACDHELCSFDGLHIKRHDKLTGWPIRDGWIYIVDIDASGNLWVGSKDTCLFVCIDQNDPDKKFITYNRIPEPMHIACGEKEVWCTTKDSLFQIKQYKITHAVSLPDEFKPNRRYSCEIVNGSVYLSSSNNTLLKYTIQAGFVSVSSPETGKNILGISRSGDTLYILRTNDVDRLINDKVYPFFHSDELIDLKYLFADNKNRIWICASNGVAVLKNEKLQWTITANNHNIRNGDFSGGDTDPEGNVWLCNGAGGVYQVRSMNFVRYSNFQKEEEPVYGILQDNSGTFWFGYYDQFYLTKLRIGDNGTTVRDTIKTTINPILNAYDPVRNKVYYIGDTQGALWIDQNTTQYIEVDQLVSKYPWNPFFDPRDSSMYITGMKGLTKIKNNHISYIHSNEYSGINLGLFVYKGVVTSKDIFLGTNMGLRVVEDTIIKSIPELSFSKDNYVIASDSRDNVWTNAGGNRILRFWRNKKGNIEYRLYDMMKLFGITGPFSIYCKGNYFVLRSFDHLYVAYLSSVLAEKPKIIASLDKYDGLKPEEPLYVEMYIDADTQLWNCGAYGAYRYDFLSEETNSLPPLDHITAIKLKGDFTQLSAYCSGFEGEDRLPVNLKIPYSKNEISFEYFAITFSGHEKVYYKTRLIGLQTQWSAPFQDRHITYNNLSPGKYTFLLLACNGDGVWNTKPYEFSFIVKPPWYQTTWFRALLAMGMAGLIYFVFLLRVNRLRMLKERQEKLTQAILQSQEDERKRIARELHDGVGQELSMLKVTAKKENVKNIETKVEKIIEDVRFLSRNIHPHYFEKLGLTKAIEMLVDEHHKMGEVYWAREIENINEYFNPNQQLNIYRTIQECINNIHKHSKAKNAKITVSKQNNQVHILIQDNGAGFVVDQRKLTSLGLSTMKERIKSLNGNLQISSKPGEGTQTSITLPIK